MKLKEVLSSQKNGYFSCRDYEVEARKNQINIYYNFKVLCKLSIADSTYGTNYYYVARIPEDIPDYLNNMLFDVPEGDDYSLAESCDFRIEAV